MLCGYIIFDRTLGKSIFFSIYLPIKGVLMFNYCIGLGLGLGFTKNKISGTWVGFVYPIITYPFLK